jgi:hypothetical protein
MKAGTFIYVIIIGLCMSFTVADAQGQMGFNMADFKAASRRG